MKLNEVNMEINSYDELVFLTHIDRAYIESDHSNCKLLSLAKLDKINKQWLECLQLFVQQPAQNREVAIIENVAKSTAIRPI